MTESPVLAAGSWPTNAEMIEQVARLGYLNGRVLDLTYGRGKWWTKWRPDELDPYVGNFLNTNYRDELFDAVTYDPPYVCPGGRSTTGLPDFFDRYGLMHTPKSPAELQVVMDLGLAEAHRVCKTGGYVLMKCQDYVSSGKLWLGVTYSQQAGLKLGMEVFDVIHHISGTRAQPSRSRQVHARRNLSTLLVFKKKRVR